MTFFIAVRDGRPRIGEQIYYALQHLADEYAPATGSRQIKNMRAKLRTRAEFGQWDHVPFADVLALARRS